MPGLTRMLTMCDFLVIYCLLEGSAERQVAEMKLQSAEKPGAQHERYQPNESGTGQDGTCQ